MSATQGPASGSSIDQAGEVRSARVESLRALAALGVLNGHVFGTAHGWGAETTSSFFHRSLLGVGFGVLLFFTLSGYLLYWPFAKHAFSGGTTIDLRRYSINRLLRIMPLYYVVLVVVLLLQMDGGTFEQWWRYGLFLENFSPRTISPGEATVVGTMWSLVVELHFYLLLPLLALGIAAAARGRLGRAAIVLGALALASLAARLATVQLDDTPDVLWRYSLPTTFFYFVAGMLIALLRLQWQARPPTLLKGPVGSADAWLLASVPIWLVLFWRYSLDPVAAPASLLMVAACVLPLRPGPLVRILEWRPLAAVGIASYSLYLWHVPIVDELGRADWTPGSYPGLFTLAVPLCLLVAFVSYRFVEAPFLRLRRRWSDAAAAQEHPRSVLPREPARSVAPSGSGR